MGGIDRWDCSLNIPLGFLYSTSPWWSCWSPSTAWWRTPPTGSSGRTSQWKETPNSGLFCKVYNSEMISEQNRLRNSQIFASSASLRWKYGVNSVTEVHIHPLSHTWSWSNIKRHRENLKAYKNAYKTKLLSQGRVSQETEQQVQVKVSLYSSAKLKQSAHPTETTVARM